MGARATVVDGAPAAGYMSKGPQARGGRYAKASRRLHLDKPVSHARLAASPPSLAPRTGLRCQGGHVSDLPQRCKDRRACSCYTNYTSLGSQSVAPSRPPPDGLSHPLPRPATALWAGTSSCVRHLGPPTAATPLGLAVIDLLKRSKTHATPPTPQPLPPPSQDARLCSAARVGPQGEACRLQAGL